MSAEVKPYAEMSHEAVAFAARVAKALNEIEPCSTSHGNYYIAQAEICFDGEPTGMSVVADEFDDYSIRMEANR